MTPPDHTRKTGRRPPVPRAKKPLQPPTGKGSLEAVWIVVLLLVTGLAFAPMLKNGFTNWDDELYVVNNPLLNGPDWHGIFTRPVVSNYHPLTMASLALNYDERHPSATPFLAWNLALHLANTLLVFLLVRMLSDGRMRVAVFTAAVFALHPMHVESVAWISERKDVLYALFFLLSLMAYWRYLLTSKTPMFWLSFLLFACSALSKPAAIVLPLVLILLDVYAGRKMTLRLLAGKIPFLLVAAAMGIVTLMIQSEKAIAGLDTYALWLRPLFACSALVDYLLKFVIPYPLSSFHPYPHAEQPGWFVYFSPLLLAAVVALFWRARRHKAVVFGGLFFLVNLLLVLQVVAIGNTLTAERYTYMPYVGLAFALFMTADRLPAPRRTPVFAGAALVLAVFAWMTHERTQVWKDSNTLWSDVLKTYPDAYIPRNNRANYLSKLASDPAHRESSDALYRQALDDCNVALQQQPAYVPSYETRGIIYLMLGNYTAALEDGNAIIRLKPDYSKGYSIRGYARMQSGHPEEAAADFTTCIALNPSDVSSYTNRGMIRFNHFRKYGEALADFDRAVQLTPTGSVLLARSRCHFALGDTVPARDDARAAQERGAALPDDYRLQLGL
jgi:tetratricopeptide (TPR) repeat protein